MGTNPFGKIIPVHRRAPACSVRLRVLRAKGRRHIRGVRWRDRGFILSSAANPLSGWGCGDAPLRTSLQLFALGKSSSRLSWDLWPKPYREEVTANLAGAPYQRQGCTHTGDAAGIGSVPPSKALPRKCRVGFVQKGRGTLERGWAVPVLLCRCLRLATASSSLPLAPGQAACS